MGCDIYLTVERREPNGPWTRVEGKFYDDQNYDLFAILAGVRNGSDFAGVKTGEKFVPISKPRGIPDDAAPETKEFLNRHDVVGHSHSYHTVRQIMEYDWTQTLRKQGIVGVREWAQYKVDGRPQSWRGVAMGSTVRRTDPASFELALSEFFQNGQFSIYSLYRGEDAAIAAFVSALELSQGTRPMTTVFWTVLYYDVGQMLLGRVLPRLWRLGSPDDVRILFFFDN